MCDWPQSADQPLISHPTECLAAYDEVTFSMFIEVFRYLPLATIINSQVRFRDVVAALMSVGPCWCSIEVCAHSNVWICTHMRARERANTYTHASAHTPAPTRTYTHTPMPADTHAHTQSVTNPSTLSPLDN